MQPSTPQLGFEISFRFADGLPEDGALELWDDFVAGPLESRGLTFQDGNGQAASVTRLLFRHGASATEDDRRVIREWARRRGEIAQYEVGPLTILPV